MGYILNPQTGVLEFVSGSSGGGGGTKRTQYKTLSPAEALAKTITLNDTPSDPDLVTLDVIGGSSQINSFDYQVTGDQLTWNGLGLDLTLETGDRLRIIYEI